jgi:hypothetical protein
LLAASVAGLLSLLPGSAAADLRALSWVGGGPAYAQGDMDIGILSPSWTSLPLSVQPGQTFDLQAATAPGAHCSGQLYFRAQPPIDLDEQVAPGGTCTWTIETPSTAAPGTGTIHLDIDRSGQSWFLAGVLYVDPHGESR